MRLPRGRGLHPHPHRASANTVRWECAWQGEEEGKGQFDWSWVNNEKDRRWSREILGGGAGVGTGLCSHIKGFGLLLLVGWEATGGCEPRSDMTWLVFLEDYEGCCVENAL